MRLRQILRLRAFRNRFCTDILISLTLCHSAEWVNSVVKKRLHKAFALHHEDVRTREEFKALLQVELDEIAEDLTNSRLFFANLAELRKVVEG